MKAVVYYIFLFFWFSKLTQEKVSAQGMIAPYGEEDAVYYATGAKLISFISSWHAVPLIPARNPKALSICLPFSIVACF